MARWQRFIFRANFSAIMLCLLLLVGFDYVAQVIDESDKIRQNYQFIQVLQFSLLKAPSALVTYAPLASLLGCLLGMGGLAASSELTVLRVTGISVLRLCSAALMPVLAVVVFTLLVSQFVLPSTERWSKTLKDLSLWGDVQTISASGGLWHREGDEFIHMGVVQHGGLLLGVNRFVFSDGKLERLISANRATFITDRWLLEDVQVTTFRDKQVDKERFSQRSWDTGLTPSTLTFLSAEPEKMAPTHLAYYANYLSQSGLDSSAFELAFWQKTLLPLSIIGLVLLALSFIFGPLRDSTAGYRIFVGIMVGIVFQFAQNLLGPSSLVFGFSPIAAVLGPILIVLVFALLLLKRAG